MKKSLLGFAIVLSLVSVAPTTTHASVLGDIYQDLSGKVTDLLSKIESVAVNNKSESVALSKQALLLIQMQIQMQIQQQQQQQQAWWWAAAQANQVAAQKAAQQAAQIAAQAKQAVATTTAIAATSTTPSTPVKTTQPIVATSTVPVPIATSTTSKTVATTTPSVSLTINGSHSVSVNPGDSLTYVWKSSYDKADTFKAYYTSDNIDKCGSSTSSIGKTSSGTYTESIPSWHAGCNYTFTYTATESKTGSSISDSVTIKIGTLKAAVISVYPTTLNFGGVDSNGSSGLLSFNIVNTGNESSSVSIAGPSGSPFSSWSSSETVSPYSTTNVKVSYYPDVVKPSKATVSGAYCYRKGVGLQTSYLTVSSTAGQVLSTIYLYGTATGKFKYAGQPWVGCGKDY